MTARRAFGFLVAAVVAAPVLVALGSAPAQAVTGCGGSLGPGQTRYTWTGNGADDDWSNAQNWSATGARTGQIAPTYYGSVPSSDDSNGAFVCVAPAAPVTITLDSNAQVHVQALDVAGATLVAGVGSRVMVYAPAASAVSTIGATATVRLRGGTLGGPGQIDVVGTVAWGELDSATAKLDNDFCADFPAGEAVDACAGIATTGLLRVASGGELRVGRGVNLSDGYHVRVASGGDLVVEGSAYIAAEWTTTTTVDPGGTFTFAGDGNVFEGTFEPGDPATAGIFVNDGLVEKSAGAGRSTLNVRYSGDGDVVVTSGGLSIAGGAEVRGTVAEDARLGTGTCVGGDITVPTRVCTPVTTELDQQFAVISPTASAEDVSVVEGSTLTPDDEYQPAIEVEADDAVDDAVVVPSTIDFEFHDSARPVRLQTAIFQRRPGLESARLPFCNAGGAMPREVSSCIVGRSVVGTAIRVRVNSVRPSGTWSLRESSVDFAPLTSPLVGVRPGCMVTHASYPNVAYPYLRMRVADDYSIRFSPVQNTRGSGSVAGAGTAPAGLSKARIEFRRTGWIAAVVDNEGVTESSGSFRVISTSAVAFTRRSKSATAGRTFQLRGVVKPYHRQGVVLFAARVPSGSSIATLRSTGKRVTTDSAGRFTFSYRTGTPGRYVFAVYTQEPTFYGRTNAMSRQVVRVRVAAPVRVAPSPTVTRDFTSGEKTTTSPPAGSFDPLDNLTNFYTGRSSPCPFRVRY